MTTPYKKALSPDRPNEKQLSKAISPPPCQRCIPIYPLRYGIADKALDKNILPTLATGGYPALTSGKAYGLRVLRPGTYVYLFYFENGRMWTQHYQVTEDVRFARIWWGRLDENDAAPGRQTRPDTASAKPFLLAPERQTAETVYLMVSETLLTHRTLWDIEINKDGLRNTLAIRIKPADGAEQKHAFNATLLGSVTPELVSPAVYGTPRYYGWSEIRFSAATPDYNNILGNMYTELRPRMDVIPLAVVLQDPIGIASELHYLCADSVKTRDNWQLNNKHKLQSAALIDGYFKSVETSSNAATADAAQALRRQRELVNLKGARAFRPSYEKSLASFNEQVAVTGADVVSWAKLLGKSQYLGQALNLFDLSCITNALDYERVVLNCFGALVHTDAGLKELERLIGANPSDSPFWKSLAAGDEYLLDRISAPLTIAKNVFSAVDKYVEQYAGTVTTQALAGLIQHYVATAPEAKAKVQIERLRHVSERRFGITLGYRLITVADYLRYSMELQGYLTLGEDAYARWNLQTLPEPGGIHGTTRVSGVERIEIWEWETVDSADVGSPSKQMPLTENPLLRNLKKMKDSALASAEQIRGPVGIGFTGVGGVIAVWGLRGALLAFNKESNLTTFTASFGASLAVISSGIEVGALVTSIIIKRGRDAYAAQIIKDWGFKWGTTTAGSAAAGILALADGMRAINAYNDSNPEQARMYLAAALSGGVVSVATLMGPTTVSLGPISITPLGWLVIAAVGVGSTVWFTLKADDTAHSPIDLWLKHSAWGVNARRFTLNQELEAWHSLHYRPRISAKWEASGGGMLSRFFSNAGTLRLRCTLPNTGAHEHLDSKLQVALRGKKLHPIDSTNIQTQGSFMMNLDENYFITSLTNNQGVERGWAIAMHEDAHVSLEYLYQPDRKSMPEVALLQQGAPKPLVFTSGGLFSNPIDMDQVAPVAVPQ